MQVLPFYDFLWSFYTELQWGFVDLVKTVVLLNVKRTPDVPIQLDLLSERESSVSRKPVNFRNLFSVQNDSHSRPTPNCEQH